MQSAFTYNINRNYSQLSSYQSPTGFEFSNGVLSGGRYVVKVNGSVNLPWGLRSGANFQSQDGGVRNSTINGPGQVLRRRRRYVRSDERCDSKNRGSTTCRS